jgi:amino acid adenylation domain-containing protein
MTHSTSHEGGRVASRRTLVDILRWRAEAQPDRLAYVFLRDGEVEEARWTYRDLAAQASRVAALLRARCRQGDRALLLYPPGLDFIAAFLGCLSAGVVAVPVAAPRRAREIERLRPVAADARPAVVLTTVGMARSLGLGGHWSFDDVSAPVPVLACDEAWRDSAGAGAALAGAEGPEGTDLVVAADDLALLQYTSGSTAAPRGVMVRHRHLMANEAAITRAFRHDEHAIVAGWLPFFHDMGLIGNVLQPPYAGIPCILMSPLAFMQRPVRWLRMIATWGATTSGGPDFAYDLCARKVSDEEKRTLDLSGWRVAFTGAEPVRADTLRRFATAFAPCGFRESAWLPCFGLAEATLMVSGRARASAPTVLDVDRAALSAGHIVTASEGGDGARSLVGCGPAVDGVEIAIVDPETRRTHADGHVGEIWIAGPGVADGYWSDAAATASTFRATLATREGAWLRTGDLGFLRGGELFVAGRLKDLIIVRGRNHHPSDLELTVGQAHAVLLPGGCAAFAIERDGEERVIVVQECATRTIDQPDAIHAAIRAAVSREHDLELDTIVLVTRGGVPKTTSGKTQRGVCRERFLNGELPVIASWTRAAAATGDGEVEPRPEMESAGAPAPRPAAPPEREEARAVQRLVSGVLGLRVTETMLDEPLVRLGLSSIRAVELLHALDERFGLTVTFDELLDRLTMRDLIARVRASGADDAREGATAPSGGASTPASPRACRLSANQQSIYAAQQVAPDSAAYHIVCAERVEGLDAARMQDVLRELTARHPALRARLELRDGDGQPWQVVAADVALAWTEMVSADASVESLIAQARADAMRPFPLDQAPLWRATLVRHDGHPRLLVLTFHHLIVDLWSLAIVWRELVSALRASSSSGAAVTDVAVTRVAVADVTVNAPDACAEFVESQAELLAGEQAEPLRQFWTRKIGADPPVLALPAKGARPPRQRHRGARETRLLDHSIAPRILDVSRQHGVTPFVALISAFEALLARYTGQTDFFIGTPTAGREQAAIRETVGYFVNPVALRADLSGDPTFLDLLARVQRELRDALAHAAYPFAAVGDLVRPRRGPERAPLCDAMFVYQEAPQGAEALGAFAVGVEGARVAIGDGWLQPIPFDPGTSQRDLTVTAAFVSGELVIAAEYDTDLFDAAFVRTLLAHYEQLLDSCLAEPGARLSRAVMLSAGERPRLLDGGRPWVDDALSAACLQERFEAQAARTPEAVAVRCDGEELTYAGLNRRANRLARRLHARGAGPDRLVAIDMERSLDLATAILATLKAGAAYLPLDPAYPPARLAFMLADAHPIVLLTHAARASAAPQEFAPLRLCVDEDRAAIAAQDETDLGLPAHALNLAYVIYTSGSTGQPKGCMVTHHNVLRLFDRLPPAMRFDARETWTMFHSAAFDFSVWEIWGAWLHGGRLVIVPQATCREPEAFARLLRAEGVTILSQTPTAFRSLLQALGPHAHAQLPHVRRIVFGGEALEFRGVASWFGAYGESDARLVNMYGITETTVHVTYRELSHGETVPPATDRGPRGYIGAPLPDLRLYILDAQLEPVPAGVTGEIYVGGAGLARGYLHRPDLTATRFVPDPFAQRPGERLYRSGDLARCTSDGDIEYLGRSDQQVQLHGFRVEPAEVEAALERHPGVRQAVVLPQPALAAGWAFEADERPEPAWQVRGYRRYLKARPVERRAAEAEWQLVAYVVPDPDTRPTVGELRQYLALRVPFYMLPAACVMLDRLPTTENGKIHRAALPPPGAQALEARAGRMTRTPARTRNERTLLEAWRAALPPGELGIDDNFFTAGGDSIRAIQAVARAADAGLRLSVQDFYQHQTIRELAAAAQDVAASFTLPVRGSDSATDAVEPGVSAPPARALISDADRARLPEEVEDAYPLARMQAGLIYHSEQHPDSPVYRASFLYRFEGAFDAAAFEAAAQGLVDHHPILRTGFDLGRYAEPLQLVYRDVAPGVTVEDLRALDAAAQERAIDAWFDRERARGFDFTRPPLARFTVHCLSSNAFTVGLTCHDAILDGWSTALVLTELLQRYAAQRTGQPFVPATPRTAYRDVVALEREDMAAGAGREFWTRTLHRCDVAPLVVTPPSDAALDEAPRLGVVDVHLPRELSESLLRIARQAGVPLKHLLLAVHLRIVQTWSGADDVITGLEVNGRPEQPGGEWSVGQHLNTVPFRHQIKPGSWRELVDAVGQCERALLPFRRWPYAEIQRQRGGVPLYDTTFNYTHFHVFEALQRLPGLRVQAGHGRELTHYTLKTEFNRDVFTDRLHLDVIFNASRMAASQAESIAASYVEALRALAASPDARHDAAPLVGDADLRDLRTWATGETVPRAATTITRLCEAQRDRTPARAALEMDGVTLSYAELHARANRLARRLRARGIGPEDFVGVHLARSFDLVVALLAVLKAGAAYVPLDVGYPPERLRQMTTQAGARLVITTAARRDAIPAAAIVAIDDVEGEDAWDAVASGDPARDERQLQAIYALFTSGSTGQPKGAVNTHEGLCNRLLWMQEAYPLAADDRVLQKTPIGFDVSGWELWWPLIAGATMVLARPGGEGDGQYLAEVIREARVTTVHFVPSMLRLFLNEPGARECVGLRRIICSGEALDADLVRRCHDLLPCDLHNLYGPTEAAIDVTAWTCERGALPGSAVPIGRPIANTRAFVLDRHGLPAPPGAVGELYLAGPNLARGYARRPDLTAERFLPCAWPDAPAGARMYRTGDRARLRADGAIEFLGRVDAQVKLHGVRIELGDVEAALAQHPACAAAAVTIHADAQGHAQLVAYVVPRAGALWTVADLRTFLRERLPGAMVPSRYVALDALPRTPGGKIDRRQLPPPEAAALADLLRQVETMTDEDARSLLANAVEG